MIMKSYYLDNNKNNNISLAYIWIDGGTSLDKKEKKGINQILCSLLTRGCKKYSNYEFSDFLNSYGAELNLEAFEDGISICLKSLSEYFDKLFPLLKFIIEEPNLYEKEFIYCKNESLNNVLKAKENLFNITFNNFKKIIYKDHPYSLSCIGDMESINLINYGDILKEYKSFKRRNKYLLTNRDKYSFLNLNNIKDSINELKVKKKNSKLILKNNNNYIENNSNTKQVLIIIGSQTCPHNSQDSLSLKILESYLSYGMSSLLFKVFREKNGLTYESGVFFPTRKFNAPFLIYLSTSEKNALLSLNLLLSIWKDLLSKKISNKELSLAKLKLKTSLLHNYRTLEEVTFRKIRLLSLGMDPFYDEKSKILIKEINSDQILNVSKRYLNFPCISISGNEKLCQKIKEIWKKNF
tara:strand:- start:454 stop:1683 length:1230 start_codon:yes stop_codon:yes gene_type:complete